MRYLEDFHTGQRCSLGEHTVTTKEILAFAEQWDPQRFHTDPDEARNTPYGGLIASGWHTTSIFMRLYVTTLLRDSSGIGSPGVDDIRWKEPVRPGDTLTATFEVESITPSLGHPDRGTVKPRCELTNQHGQSVLTMYLHSSFLRRPPPNPAGAQATETIAQPMWCLPDSEQRSLERSMETSEWNRKYRNRP
jgi:acyl dehydratase